MLKKKKQVLEFFFLNKIKKFYFKKFLNLLFECHIIFRYFFLYVKKLR